MRRRSNRPVIHSKPLVSPSRQDGDPDQLADPSATWTLIRDPIAEPRSRDATWDPVQRRLVPLVHLLARQAAAETIGECFNHDTPATQEPTR